MDVSDQILSFLKLYGTRRTVGGLVVANKTNDLSVGNTIQKPEIYTVESVPNISQWQSEVGLFQNENHFIKVKFKIEDVLDLSFEAQSGFEPATANYYDPDDKDFNYTAALLQKDLDDFDDINYDPARIGNNGLPIEAYVSVELSNLKTGNHFVDNWFDVRLYTEEKEEHPYDLMYVPQRASFYIGFHARNTKTIPYNVKLAVGRVFVDPSQISDKSYIMKSSEKYSY